MVATIIAYAMAAFLAFLAFGGVILFFQKDIGAEATLTRFVLTVVLGAAAWGCAYLGGI